MSEECITFNIGKININAKTNQFELKFDEHRKICNEKGQFSFEFGTIIDDNKVFLAGHSIKPEKNLENYKFILHTYLNDKMIHEGQVDYDQVVDLFTHDVNSELLRGFRGKSLPSSKTKRAVTGSQKRQSHQLSQKTEKGKTILQPGKKEGYVINPESGAEIKIGGPTYEELCKSGKYTC